MNKILNMAQVVIVTRSKKKVETPRLTSDLSTTNRCLLDEDK